MVKQYLKILLIFLLVFFLSSCNKQANKSSKKSTGKKNRSVASKGITALKAWEKVKPQADKWSSNFKIAAINDVSTPSVQRIDGRSIGWEFYLEVCEGDYYRNICRKGKTRSFYYLAEKMVGRQAGVSADQEVEMTSGRPAFDASLFKIDSDKAQEIARQFVKRERNNNEEFIMDAYSNGDIAYWAVRRQCWTLGENCDSKNGYSAYVNLTTGEAYKTKPKGKE